MKNEYDVLFRDTCHNLDLPVAKVKAFALALTGLNPEFRTSDIMGPRTGLLAVPDREAISHGVLPGDLVKPEKNILAGVELLRECYDYFWEIGDEKLRFVAGMNFYLRDWLSMQDTYKVIYDRVLDNVKDSLRHLEH
jgi:hypothetical protein